MESERGELMHSAVLLAHRWFRWHVAAYLLGNALLQALNGLTAAYWWAFWPLFFWSLLLACHYFTIRGFSADEDWAEARAKRLRARSYDIDHILSIDRSFRQGTMPGRHDLSPEAGESEARPADAPAGDQPPGGRSGIEG